MIRLETLVKKATYGDIKAYAEIVERTRHMACGYAFSILGDFHSAEDASQEAFIEAYQRLVQLDEPKAFLSWLRKIIFKMCDRQLRKRKLLTSSLEENQVSLKGSGNPAIEMEVKERQQQVADAIMRLPQKQREVTSLFYINGYSYKDISSFLDVPVTTIKKRLHDSRNTLRERIIDMVEDGLKNNMPDKHFTDGVITELLSRPRLLEIESHPLRKAVEAITSELKQYEYFEGSEIVDEEDLVGISSDLKSLFKTKDGKYLRAETTVTTYTAIKGRTPPVNLITAGRVFRPDKEDASHLKVFHQLDAICVKPDVYSEDMRAELEHSVRSVIGNLPLRWVKVDYRYLAEWIDVAGCGMLSEKMLNESGFDPNVFSGFAFGIGLERLVAIKLCIKDIRQLWQHPYV